MNRKLLTLGLIFPGAGSLLRGRWLDAGLALWTVLFLVALTVAGLLDANLQGRELPLDPRAALDLLPKHPRITPQVAVTGIAALATHLLTAFGPARNPPAK
ncbi:MAG: hypothetical protein ACOYOB_00435 [Myxococcota bacterium]